MSDSKMQLDGAERELAAAWRCGVSTGVEVTDRVLALMAKSRSKAVRKFHDMLDREMQIVMDARHSEPVACYQDAFAAHKKINNAAAERLTTQEKSS